MRNAKLFSESHFVIHKKLLIQGHKNAFGQKAKTFFCKNCYICKIEMPLL